ncbi:MAG: hypothetical protein ACYT04_76405, partial [Nostoc sp.]
DKLPIYNTKTEVKPAFSDNSYLARYIQNKTSTGKIIGIHGMREMIAAVRVEVCITGSPLPSRYESTSARVLSLKNRACL